MQNAVNKNESENVVGISSAHVSDAIRRVHESNAMFAQEVIDNASRVTDSVCIVKKDGGGTSSWPSPFRKKVLRRSRASSSRTAQESTGVTL